jgi:hypothetical protein
VLAEAGGELSLRFQMGGVASAWRTGKWILGFPKNRTESHLTVQSQSDLLFSLLQMTPGSGKLG